MAVSPPLRRPPDWAFPSALACGILGGVANAFLVGFLVLTYPHFADPTWGWLGFANDVIGIGQFLTLIPVIHAVGRLLPSSRMPTVVTTLALIATAGLVIVSVALVTGVMDFDIQVRFVIALLVPLYGWLIVANSVGHRANALPRSVTRFGLLLGVSWPATLLLMLAGLLIGGVDLGQQQFGLPGVLLVVPAIALGTLNWLLLPLWPLQLARTVFRPGRLDIRLPERAGDSVDLEARR